MVWDAVVIHVNLKLYICHNGQVIFSVMIEVMESEQEYKITIKPSSNEKLIHVYKKNPEIGYVVLESDEP